MTDYVIKIKIDKKINRDFIICSDIFKNYSSLIFSIE